MTFPAIASRQVYTSMPFPAFTSRQVYTSMPFPAIASRQVYSSMPFLVVSFRLVYTSMAFLDRCTLQLHFQSLLPDRCTCYFHFQLQPPNRCTQHVVTIPNDMSPTVGVSVVLRKEEKVKYAPFVCVCVGYGVEFVTCITSECNYCTSSLTVVVDFVCILQRVILSMVLILLL